MQFDRNELNRSYELNRRAVLEQPETGELLQQSVDWLERGTQYERYYRGRAPEFDVIRQGILGYVGHAALALVLSEKFKTMEPGCSTLDNKELYNLMEGIGRWYRGNTDIVLGAMQCTDKIETKHRYDEIGEWAIETDIRPSKLSRVPIMSMDAYDNKSVLLFYDGIPDTGYSDNPRDHLQLDRWILDINPLEGERKTQTIATCPEQGIARLAINNRSAIINRKI